MGKVLNKVLIRSQRNLLLLDLSNISCIEARGRSSLWHCENDKYIVNAGIQSLEEMLSSLKFVRVHRSYIVNVDQICEIKPDSNRGLEVKLQNGTKLTWSRHYMDRFYALQKISHLIPSKTSL